ncbi:putative ethylene-responsive transcription factor ERF121 [Actinidia eriantha]|uniref:putative ethylene-responsive transcription factor ERF121 n=1 Tax=Actinidia eriantha TaxID=165200 RepID=UPI002585AEA6|nr:putative ethylene-responsive transcription factor ERF121 [Actinidia eriantha]
MDPSKKQMFSSNSQQDENVLTFLPPLMHLTREQEASIMVSTLEHIISGNIGGGVLRDATLSSSGTEIESNCPMLSLSVDDICGHNKINKCLECNFFAANTTTKGEKKRELRQMLEGKWVAESRGPRRAKSCDSFAVEFRGDFETTQEPAKPCSKSAVEVQEPKASFPLFDCQSDQGSDN